MSQGIRHAPLFTFLLYDCAPYHKYGALAHTFSCIVEKNVSLSTVLLVQHVKDLLWQRIGCAYPVPRRTCRRADWLRLSFPTYVENNGFEPLTPCLQSRCSSQLS